MTSLPVTEAGFVPATVTVPARRRVELRFTRRTERTCATEVVMTVDGVRSSTPLPLGTPVVVRATFPRPGVVRYACAMDMIEGAITVR